MEVEIQQPIELTPAPYRTHRTMLVPDRNVAPTSAGCKKVCPHVPPKKGLSLRERNLAFSF